MPTLRIVRAVDLVRVPWKNGGGTTAEIATCPEGSSFDTFLWRISMADVASDGPFSRFPGVERTLVLAQGRDLVLDIEGETRRLAAPGDALSFSGDVATAARLEGGPIRDINVMTRRGRFTHRLTRPAGDLAGWTALGPVAIAALGDAVTVTTDDCLIDLGRLDVLIVEGACTRLTPRGDTIAILFAVA